MLLKKNILLNDFHIEVEKILCYFFQITLIELAKLILTIHINKAQFYTYCISRVSCCKAKWRKILRSLEYRKYIVNK